MPPTLVAIIGIPQLIASIIETGTPSLELTLINKSDENYQNFLDFPILVKKKENLNKFLLSHGIEVRMKHYYNCAKMFNNKSSNAVAEKYEKELICLPVHPKITPSYISFVAKKINQFYEYN